MGRTGDQRDHMFFHRLLSPRSTPPSLVAAVVFQPRLLMVLLVVVTGGCGYVVGPLHREQVRSIAVPVFACEDDRRGLGLRLTEAVHKEIQRQLPYLSLIHI